MKRILIIILILGLTTVGCNKKNDVQKIEAKIARYKQQVSKLNAKIKELEAQISDTSVQHNLIYVDTMIAHRQKFVHYVEIPGTAIAEEDIFITSEINGQIKKIYVKEGQYVKKGQLLVKLKDDVLKSNLAQLESQFYYADTLYQKQKRLYEKKIISEAQYLQSKSQRDALLKNIEVIKEQIKMTNIYAPFSGVVDQIFAKEGQMAMPNVRLMELVNLNSINAEANISEKYLPILKIGSPVTINIPLYPDIKINSKITWISNVIDPASRTIKIKAPIPNKDKLIKNNMTVVLKFIDYQEDNIFVIPTNALVQDIKGWYLYTVAKDTNNQFIAKKKYVEIGLSDNNLTIIKSGLEDGDAVITKGANLVREGSQILLPKN